MKKFWIFFLLAAAQIQAAELTVTTHNIQASNMLYDSMNLLPGEQALFEVSQLMHRDANTFLWYVEGEDPIKTCVPQLAWTVSARPGWKRVVVIAMNDKGRIDGASFKLYVGNLETPRIAIQDGAKRAGCPLTLRAHVNPYLGASVDIREYLWTVEKSGSILGEYVTAANTLDFLLPQEPGFVDVKVSAVDVRAIHSPAGLLRIDVKPW